MSLWGPLIVGLLLIGVSLFACLGRAPFRPWGCVFAVGWFVTVASAVAIRIER